MHNDILKSLSAPASVFEQMMALRGASYRHLEGRLTQRVELGGKFYFIKQHVGIGWKEIFKNLLQLRLPVLSAKNEWLAIKKLQSLGISAPGIVGFGKRGINPAHMESFILMEELAPTISLEELCQTWPSTPPTFAIKRRLIEQVAYIAKTMHANGINHRDFYLCHFLLDIAAGLHNISAQTIKLSLIDLHRAQIRRLTPMRWIIKDLSGLHFSSKDIGLTQRDLYRFMKAYTGKSLGEILKLDQTFWQKVRARGEQIHRNHTQR